MPGSLIQVTEEITAFGDFAASRSPQRICEIGTFNGGTSLFLAGLAPSVRSYVGVDLEPKNGELVHALASRSVQFKYLVGSSRDPEIRRQVTECSGGEPLDLLFIDGDHSYDGVRADFLEFRGLVRPGGLIAFHDIVPHPRGNAGEVPRFWQDVKDKMPSHEFVRSWDQQGFGIGVLENDPTATL